MKFVRLLNCVDAEVLCNYGNYLLLRFEYEGIEESIWMTIDTRELI